MHAAHAQDSGSEVKRDRYIIGPALKREPEKWRCTKNGTVLVYEASQRKLLAIIVPMLDRRWKEYGEPSELQIKGVDGKIRDSRTYGNDPRGTKG